MDLIEMHIATRQDTAPAAAQPYPLALKHHDFLKQEIKKIARCRNHTQKHVPMGKPYYSSEKNTHLKAHHNSFTCVLITES